MDNLHYRLIFYLSQKELLTVVKFQKFAWLKKVVMCEKYSLETFANFLIMLRAEIVTTFGSKKVTIFTRNTKTWKICVLRKAIFSVFYNISAPMEFFGILLLLKVLSGSFVFCLGLPRSKIVYYANCQLA